MFDRDRVMHAHRLMGEWAQACDRADALRQDLDAALAEIGYVPHPATATALSPANAKITSASVGPVPDKAPAVGTKGSLILRAIDDAGGKAKVGRLLFAIRDREADAPPSQRSRRLRNYLRHMKARDLVTQNGVRGLWYLTATGQRAVAAYRAAEIKAPRPVATARNC